MQKIIAVVLVLVGIGLIGLAGYGYFFNEERSRCDRLRSEAVAKLNEATKAQGTPREAALVKEARETSAEADQMCGFARQTQQNMMWLGLGGLAAIIVSVVLLVISRRRTA